MFNHRCHCFYSIIMFFSQLQLLISISSFGSGLFLILMGGHDFCKTALLLDVSAYGWVPLLSLSGVCFISSIGMVSLPYVVSAELLPEKIRAAVIGNLSVMQALVSFTYFQHFNWLIAMFNMYGTMWLFGTFCWSYTAFTLLVLPETKGKSFGEITKMLRSKE